jgi:hypothetical protein
MKLISFDIGIKNMAYCIFDVSCSPLQSNTQSSFTILDWNILNLMDNGEPIENSIMCSFISNVNVKKTKSNKNEDVKPCKKTAKYKKGGECFCEKHAKESSHYIIPKKEFSNIKSKKIEDLLKIAEQYSIFSETHPPPKMKKEIIVEMDAFFTLKCFEVLHFEVKKSANDTELITIGKNLKRKLDGVNEIEHISHVIIENQISPIATRMKTIQGMLAQYFIMKNGDISIEFISSSNKLKVIPPPSFSSTQTRQEPLQNSMVVNIASSPEKNLDKTLDKIIHDKNKYKENKKRGIEICSLFLEENPQLKPWKRCLEVSKKDDYADCFLQGIWYIQKQKQDK